MTNPSAKKYIEMNVASDRQRADSLPAALGYARSSGVLLITVFLAGLIYWGSFVPMSQAALLTGVLSSAGPKIAIRTETAGVLKAIHVQEGDRITRGTTIATLDVAQLELRAEYIRRELVLLRLEQLRLNRLLASNDDLIPGPELTTEINALHMQPARVREQALLTAALAKGSSTAEAPATVQMTRLAQLERSIIEQEVLLAQSDFAIDAAQIESPTDGFIQNLQYLSPGASIPARGMLMEIVPDDGTFTVELQVPPDHVGFLVPGTPATLTIPAFSDWVTGHISATVRRISAGTFNHNGVGPDSYKAVLELDLASLHELTKSADRPLRLRFGLPVHAQIQTGSGTFFEYLFQPLRVLTQRAFKE